MVGSISLSIMRIMVGTMLERNADCAVNIHAMEILAGEVKFPLVMNIVTILDPAVATIVVGLEDSRVRKVIRRRLGEDWKKQ